MYRFFDLCIESELALPGVLECDATRADWTVAVGDGKFHETEPAWFHVWISGNGNTIVQVARSGDRYVLGFPGLASYSIDFEARRIECHALGDSTLETLSHLLLDQALPRAVCHGGRMVAHASAVLLDDGGAIAFTGESGRGKSTLASAFYRAGFEVLSDDCLLLDRRADTVRAVPAYSSLRLWPDSTEVLLTSVGQAALPVSNMAHYSEKKVLYPDHAAAIAVVAPLHALFLLKPPDSAAGEHEVGIERVRGMAAIMTLVESQFALDVVDKRAVQRSFEVVRRVAGHVPVLRLSYPRSFDCLPQVVEKVLEFIRLGA